jgi:serine/threonine protein kinase
MTAPQNLLRPNQPTEPQMENITGFEPTLEYIGLIGSGGQAEVYLVTSRGTVLGLILAERDGKGGSCRIRVLLIRQYFARKILHFLTEADKIVVEKEQRNITKLFASSIPHPNLIHVFRNGPLTASKCPPPYNIRPCYYIDMELGGRSLNDYIWTRFHLVPQNLPSPAESWNILSQLASGIEYMHERGVFHRDIKPQNCPPNPKL